jgi:hypothetical protein
MNENAIPLNLNKPIVPDFIDLKKGDQYVEQKVKEVVVRLYKPWNSCAADDICLSTFASGMTNRQVKLVLLLLYEIYNEIRSNHFYIAYCIKFH